MTVRPFLNLPPPPTVSTFSGVNEAFRRFWDALYKMRRGKIECVIELTLTAGAATTVINDERLSKQTVILFDPKTANAAAELYGGTMYALNANRTTGAFTVTHANNAQVDRHFQVALIG